MKRIIVFVLALFLAMPVMSYAGSVQSSRFDLTIGGAANFNFGYFTKDAANDGAIVHGTWGRESRSNATDIQAEHGMFRFSPAESTINLLGKGPEVWGAKTSGFVQIDFRGTNTGNNFGGAQIQYAAIKLNWPSAELLIGKFYAQTLDLYSRAFITAGDHTSTSGIGGIRPEQVAFRYNWNKNFSTMIGIIQNTNQEGATGANNSYGRSGWPGFQGEIAFQSDACGKIGPDMLKFGLGAVYAKEKKIGNTAAAASASEAEETLDVWIAGLRGLIPIIPEKKGNKTNAMFLSGIAYVGQNAWPYVGTPAPGASSYWRPARDANGAYTTATAPTLYGGMLQLTYFITNTVRANLQYGVIKNNYSEWARNTAAVATLDPNGLDYKGRDRINQFRVYAASLFYDPNPAFRLGFQWTRHFTTWNGKSATGCELGTGVLDSYSTVDAYRVQVAYFF